MCVKMSGEQLNIFPHEITLPSYSTPVQRKILLLMSRKIEGGGVRCEMADREKIQLLPHVL